MSRRSMAGCRRLVSLHIVIDGDAGLTWMTSYAPSALGSCFGIYDR